MTQNLAQRSIAQQSDRTWAETLSPNKKSRASRPRRDFSVKEIRPQMVEVVEQAIQDLGYKLAIHAGQSVCHGYAANAIQANFRERKI